MFEKFGEFDSVEELNKAAKGFKEEGDIESLKALAKENGIEEEDAIDYIDDMTEQLATAFMAAVGRLNVEKEGTKDIAQQLIIEMTKGMSTDNEIAIGIMKKGKRTDEILSIMRKKAGIHRNGSTGMCCGTDRQLQGIIRTYYTGTKEQVEKEIDDLYK